MFRIINVLPPQSWESEYLAGMASILEQLDVDREVNVIITNDRSVLPEHRSPTIVVLTSDESHGVPTYAREVLLVFKQYRPFEKASNVRPIPLGRKNGVYFGACATVTARKCDVSFSGYIYPPRAEFRLALERIQRSAHFVCSFQFSQTWGSGLPAQQYADLLGATKIALAPSGWESSESFRVFEAMEAGCVVVTTKKPSTWFYDGWPAIEVLSWDDIEVVLNDLLGTQAKLESLQEAHLSWWRRTCSESALAQYVASETITALNASAPRLKLQPSHRDKWPSLGGLRGFSLSERVFAVVSVYENPGLLAHFLEHYTRLGVHRIIVVVRTPQKDDLYEDVMREAQAYPAIVAWRATAAFDSIGKADVELEVLDVEGLQPDDYVMHLDVDEFQEYPAPLDEIVREMNARNDWALRGRIVDRLADGGLLAAVRRQPSIWEQFPIACDVTGSLLGACTQKIVLCRHRVKLDSGHHDTWNAYHDRVPVGASEQYLVHHFKWTQGLDRRLQLRLKTGGIGPDYRNECERFLEHYSQHGGIDITNPALGAQRLGAIAYPTRVAQSTDAPQPPMSPVLVETLEHPLESQWSSYADEYPTAESRATLSTSAPLRNVYACLVHENPECILDLVRNLHLNDPHSTILLYNGGDDPQLLATTLLLDRYRVLVHPQSRPMRWGWLHDFALDCMRFALTQLEFDTLTIVDSDQLSVRSDYPTYLTRYLASRPEIGMLGTAAAPQAPNTRVGPAAVAWREIDLWRPFLRRFSGGESKFPFFSFWPSTVFTAAASRALTEIVDVDAQLAGILSRSRIWASEEIILPTLTALLGFEVAANPCSHDFVRYGLACSDREIEQAFARPDVYWIHPVARNYGDKLRSRIREHCNQCVS